MTRANKIDTYHIADWNTGEDYMTFGTEKEAIEWIKANCFTENGEPWIDNGKAAFYMGNRIEMYYNRPRGYEG